MVTDIKFGTDGWRGIIADDFTYENVRLVATAIAAYVLKHEKPEKGLVIGYDTRFGSPSFAEITAETIAAHGINVILSDDYVPTPAVSFAVKHFGATGGVLAGIFSGHGIKFIELRGDVNPLFPGINPEPILPHVKAAQEAVVRERCHAGLITDGDADRIGAVDEKGNFVDSHKIYSVILRWLLERKKWPGIVVRAFNTTKMLDRIAAKHGRELVETPIGFKYTCDVMLEREVLIGGEESGGIGITRHLPERDGILNSLLLANVMADERKTLGQLVAALQKDFGQHHYARLDIHIANDLKESAIRRASNGVNRLGNYKV